MTIRRISAAVLFLCCAIQVNAETIKVPVGQQGSLYQSESRPARGTTMSEVEAQFGAPVRKYPAVGQPPITRWVYDHFTVYFENDRVIHTVLHASQQ